MGIFLGLENKRGHEDETGMPWDAIAMSGFARRTQLGTNSLSPRGHITVRAACQDRKFADGSAYLWRQLSDTSMMYRR